MAKKVSVKVVVGPSDAKNSRTLIPRYWNEKVHVDIKNPSTVTAGPMIHRADDIFISKPTVVVVKPSDQ